MEIYGENSGSSIPCRIVEDKSNAMAVVDRLDQLPFDELKKGESWEKAMHWLNAERKASDEKIVFRLISNLSNQCEQRKLDAVKNAIEEIEEIIKKHILKVHLFVNMN